VTPPAAGDGSVLRAGAVTDVGRTRQINQDAPLVADELQLWAVADGMGGHQGGEVASELAVTNLRRSYELGEGRTLDTLLDAAAGANSAVYDASREDPDLAGMGTTLVAIARTDDDELAYVSVGDSRIYLLRDGELTRLTVDHSLVEELVREGAITPEEARTHPRRNVVTRVLGIDPFVQVDSDVIIPYSGDRYVLCSDGLFNEVEHHTMASVLRRLADPADAASELVRLANENGGHDNITVLVLDVVDDDDRAGKASATIGVGPVDDMAGFSVIRASESEPVEATSAVAVAKASRRDRRDNRRAKRRAARRDRPRRFTWRVAMFLIVLAAVVGIGIAAIGYYARGTYYVGFDDDGVVTVFQGKPGGVLWFEPTVVERSQYTREDVRPELVDNVEAGIEVASRDRAIVFPITVVTPSPTTTTTTTTTIPATTTTLP
jgi:serine/threonine protein phosphatase PrpC